ncbi:MAG TPA: hypothetical protein VF877_08490, partial [Gaiellaceae bacterium]
EQVSASPDWSPDGTTIAFARFATQINSRVNVRYALQSDLYEAPADGEKLDTRHDVGIESFLRGPDRFVIVSRRPHRHRHLQALGLKPPRTSARRSANDRSLGRCASANCRRGCGEHGDFSGAA